ncbi:MAG: CTP synthase [bacterium]
MAKYIFVTGGVVSSLGKGITAASLGYLLKSCKLRVAMLKIDPYLNVDPGTMSPYQHGEVFVTEDGAETDLDLGHYERFIDINTSKRNNITSGQIYDSVISKERQGLYLGQTVQVIPHLTNEIKLKIKALARDHDIVITEIGGTTGDIEGLHFLEAIRQFKQDVGIENVLYVHVTLLPFIKAAEELKTKPTQQSVAKLREIGIEPQILICRTEVPMPESMKQKIALFCNVRQDSVIEERDVKHNIYEVPLQFKKDGLDKLVLSYLGIKGKKADIVAWEKQFKKSCSLKRSINIAVAGKYTELKDSYKSIWEALVHAGIENGIKVNVKYLNVEKANYKEELETASGILLPGGFGDRGIEGKIAVTRYARVKEIPFFGICLGMQCAVIEFARNVCNLKGAHSTEFNPNTKHPVIDLLPEQKSISSKGGTMRLGAYPCKVIEGSKAFEAYKDVLIRERHRHRYELNNKYKELFKKKGLKFSGLYKAKDLVEIIELDSHPWFLAVQFHPEFKSRFLKPHPLFREFVKASAAFK